MHVGPTFGVLIGEKEEDIAGELTERPEFQKTEIGIAGGLSACVVILMASVAPVKLSSCSCSVMACASGLAACSRLLLKDLAAF